MNIFFRTKISQSQKCRMTHHKNAEWITTKIPNGSRIVIFHNSVQSSFLYLLQPQKYQSWRRTKRTTGHSDQDSNHHIPCIVHELSSVHQQTLNWPHGYASASVRSSIGVLWQTVLESSASQHHWHLQTPLIIFSQLTIAYLCILCTGISSAIFVFIAVKPPMSLCHYCHSPLLPSFPKCLQPLPRAAPSASPRATWQQR